MKVKFKKLHPDAILPTKGSKYAAAVDLYSIETVDLRKDEFRKVRTGLAVEVPEGHFGLIAPRSGKSTKEGLILRSSNYLDEDFRGEIMICCFPLGVNRLHIEKGERIAQMAIIPILHATYFDDERVKLIIQTIRDAYIEDEVLLNFKTLKLRVLEHKSLSNDIKKDKISKIIDAISDADRNDYEHIQKKAMVFCKQQELKKAIVKVNNIIENDDGENFYECEDIQWDLQ